MAPLQTQTKPPGSYTHPRQDLLRGVGSSEPNACEQWLTEVTQDLFKPIPFKEVFVILALFLPQLTFAEGAKLDCKLWYSPAIRNELTTIHVTPIAQGLQGMHEYKIAFAPNSRAVFPRSNLSRALNP